MTSASQLYACSNSYFLSFPEGSRRAGLSLVPGWARGAVVAVGFLVFLAVGLLVLAQFVALWKYRNRNHETVALKA